MNPPDLLRAAERSQIITYLDQQGRPHAQGMPDAVHEMLSSLSRRRLELLADLQRESPSTKGKRCERIWWSRDEGYVHDSSVDVVVPAENPNDAHAPAYLRRGSEAWSWTVPKCPHCGKRHQHGGGALDADPRKLLGHRVADCVLGDGYFLVDADPERTSIMVSVAPQPPVQEVQQRDDVSGIVCSRVADIQAKPIRWLWRGRIARGKVTLVAGHPGLGKSQAVLNLGAIVTTGAKWPLGDEHCERGSVVILSAEDDAADTIRPRLEAAGADISRVHMFEAVRDQDDKGEPRTRGLSLATDIIRIAAKIAELRDVALLIVDPVSAYLGDTDSHKNADIRALLAPLADMAARHGVAVVLITHLAKNASAEALLRVQGSIAFAAAARAAWGVARDKDNPARRLFLPLKNNIGSDQTGLAFAVEGATLPGGIETSRVVWEGEPVTVSAEEAFAPDLNREDRTAVEEAKGFLAGLLADGPVPSRQVRADAEGAGHHWSAIRRAQAALGVEAIKESLKGGWTWRLPPKAVPEDAQETRRCSP